MQLVERRNVGGTVCWRICMEMYVDVFTEKFSLTYIQHTIQFFVFTKLVYYKHGANCYGPGPCKMGHIKVVDLLSEFFTHAFEFRHIFHQ